MTQAIKPKPAAPEALIFEIAAKHFFIETLETRRSDSLDFHDVAVWAIRAALEDAYPSGVMPSLSPPTARATTRSRPAANAGPSRARSETPRPAG